MKRVGVIGIVIVKDNSISIEVQKLLQQYSEIIVGRMGVPDREKKIYAISVIVEGENEKISALTGKLGKLENVNVKSAVTTVEID